MSLSEAEEAAHKPCRHWHGDGKVAPRHGRVIRRARRVWVEDKKLEKAPSRKTEAGNRGREVQSSAGGMVSEDNDTSNDRARPGPFDLLSSMAKTVKYHNQRVKLLVRTSVGSKLSCRWMNFLIMA